MEEEKRITPEEWEQEVKVRINEIINSMLKVTKDCNMGTRYFHPIKDRYETHVDYDTTKINGAELRIVFNFVEPIEKDSVNFI